MQTTINHHKCLFDPSVSSIFCVSTRPVVKAEHCLALFDAPFLYGFMASCYVQNRHGRSLRVVGWHNLSHEGIKKASPISSQADRHTASEFHQLQHVFCVRCHFLLTFPPLHFFSKFKFWSHGTIIFCSKIVLHKVNKVQRRYFVGVKK